MSETSEKSKEFKIHFEFMDTSLCYAKFSMIDAFTSKESQNQFLTIIINQQEYPYKFSVEDILADDWELIAFPIIDFKEWFDDTLNIKTFNEIEREINNA